MYLHFPGVCHSDSIVQSGSMGNTFPRIPGHEIIGDVVAVGDGERKWKAGDRVGGPWHGGEEPKIAAGDVDIE
jgi:D-arabinose 1-dehydrogenase-like Zn-dependent alcohol dehydrogenase